MKRYIYLIHTFIVYLLLVPHVLNGQESDFPYTLKKTDFITIGIGLSTTVYGYYLENTQTPLTYDDFSNLKKSNVNSFDREATSNWNKNMDVTSDVTRALLFIAPSTLLINTSLKKQWQNGFIYGLMYVEVAIVTIGLTEMTKAVTTRNRPYLYNSNVDRTEIEELISENKATDSFFSGHTSIAFASAVFLSKTFSDIYGKSTLSKIVWGSSLLIAGFTGYLRYESGNHFPTDILTGALVGSIIGYAIPVLHNTNKTKSIGYKLAPNSVHLTYSF